MLGDIDDNQKIASSMHFTKMNVTDKNLINWYDKSINIKGLTIKYQVSDMVIYGYLN